MPFDLSLLSTEWTSYGIDPTQDGETLCACCGHRTKKFMGDVWHHGATIAVYFVAYTEGHREQGVSFDLFVGPFGQGLSPAERVHARLNLSFDAGGFTVTDAPDGVGAGIAERLLRREDIVQTPIASPIYAIADAILMGEPGLRWCRV